jgi:membrane protease YdiL (CAAX protease family)
MKNLMEKRPFWFGLIVTVIIFVSGILVVAPGSIFGIPQEVLIMIVLVVAVLIPFGFIWRYGWWEDAGFVSTTKNAYALAVPVLVMPFAIILFGTVANEASVAVYWLVAVFLTGLGEEALSRGLLVRVFLPHGKWKAVIYPTLLFGISHISQFFGGGMGLADTLAVIVNAVVFALLYGAVRLRINNIWPLIIVHTTWDMFFVLAGVAGPNAVRGLSDIPLPAFLVLWVVEIAATVYLMNKPLAATIDGKPVGMMNKALARSKVENQPAD